MGAEEHRPYPLALLAAFAAPLTPRAGGPSRPHHRAPLYSTSLHLQPETPAWRAALPGKSARQEGWSGVEGRSAPRAASATRHRSTPTGGARGDRTPEKDPAERFAVGGDLVGVPVR
ncbi:hypothetical protein GCM10027259_31950 [Micromonospora palomenae]